MSSHDRSDLSVRISQCPNGCVHLQFGCAQIVLTPERFRAFAASAQRVLQEMDRGAAASLRRAPAFVN